MLYFTGLSIGTFFMLNSTEYEISSAHKAKMLKNRLCRFKRSIVVCSLKTSQRFHGFSSNWWYSAFVVYHNKFLVSLKDSILIVPKT